MYTYFFSIVLVAFIKLSPLLKDVNVLRYTYSTVLKPQGQGTMFSVRQIL